MKDGETNATSDKPSEKNEAFFDIEGQNQSSRNEAQEPTTTRSTTSIYLITYFLFNLSLTFYNKAVMGSVSCSKSSRWARSDLGTVSISMDIDSSTYRECGFWQLHTLDFWAVSLD